MSKCISHRQNEHRNIQPLFDNLNNLQATAWKINLYVYTVLKHCWTNQIRVKGLPTLQDRASLPYPFPEVASFKEMTAEQQEITLEWKKKTTKLHTANASNAGKRVALTTTLQEAEELADKRRFYFVWTKDFRGRAYPTCTFLSPQGEEWNKAMLEFADGVPIKNQKDAEWLAIHGANVFGNDKLPLLEREAWAYSYVDEAIEIYRDPLATIGKWKEADKPFLFLAWCFEWAQYHMHLRENRDGYFLTTIPCAADGTANGLQHLSAIQRDFRGARAVNLVDGANPTDIYADVAARTIELLQDLIKGKKKVGEKAKGVQADINYAYAWLEYGITRKITKRSVMIIPYSGTKQACRKYIEEALVEAEEEKGKVFPIGDSYLASVFIVDYVWEAIQDVIISAKIVMQYIKYIAGIYAAHGKHLEWITPTGLCVVCEYQNKKDEKISSYLHGEKRVFRLKAEDGGVYANKMKTSSAPNFIHSMDAAAMELAVNQARKEGIHHFAVVHDSFGTHSPNMHKFNAILREQFAEMYINHDVLEELRNHAITVLGDDKIEPVPLKGEFDITEVLSSKYMFS